MKEIKKTEKLQSTKKQLIETILLLKKQLEVQSFIVTGSIAFAYMGLTDWKHVKDVDIVIIKPTEDTIILLKSAAELFPPRRRLRYPVEGDNTYRFVKDGIEVDVFVQTEREPETFLMAKEGFKLSTIQPIVAAKKRFNRLKDILQLRSLAKLFLTGKEMTTFLDTRTCLFDEDHIDLDESEMHPIFDSSVK